MATSKIRAFARSNARDLGRESDYGAASNTRSAGCHSGNDAASTPRWSPKAFEPVRAGPDHWLPRSGFRDSVDHASDRNDAAAVRSIR
jgi:hypothetical protein